MPDLYPGGLAAFLRAPRAEVAAVAPPTAIYTIGGTRRFAALHRIDPASDAYAAHTRQWLFDAVQPWFDLGVRHLFAGVGRATKFAEQGRYRERLETWLAEGLAGQAAISHYAQAGWRVRLVGSGFSLALQQAAAVIRRGTERASPAPTLWWFLDGTAESPWEAIFDAAKQHSARTQQDLIAALYGEPIPPATLYVGTGRPQLAPDIAPPALLGAIQCYWPQRPGFVVDDETIRHILYDFAYARTTTVFGQERYVISAGNWHRWSSGRPIIGLGERHDGYWWPMPLDDTQGETA